MIFKSIFKGLFVACVIASVATWAAWIFAAIYRGFNPTEVFNSILTATLCLLLWMMVRRNECLIEEKNRWKKEYNDLVARVFKGEFQEKEHKEE